MKVAILLDDCIKEYADYMKLAFIRTDISAVVAYLASCVIMNDEIYSNSYASIMKLIHKSILDSVLRTVSDQNSFEFVEILDAPDMRTVKEIRTSYINDVFSSLNLPIESCLDVGRKLADVVMSYITMLLRTDIESFRVVLINMRNYLLTHFGHIDFRYYRVEVCEGSLVLIYNGDSYV